MGDLVGGAARACVGFRIGQENAHEFPVARIEADDGRDDIRLCRAFPRQLDLSCEGVCQVGIERNGDIVPVEEAASPALPRKASGAKNVSISARPKESVTIL
jgi:hypothetical protein